MRARRLGKALAATAVGLVVLVGLVLLLVPMLVQTDWAGERVRTTVERATGREVELGGVSFSWTRGLRVHDVIVHQRRGADEVSGPLFRMRAASLDVSLWDLWRRRLDVQQLVVSRPQITLIRYADGSFNISDLMTRPARRGGRKEPLRSVRVPFVVNGATVRYLDRAAATAVTLADADLDGEWDNGRLALEASGRLNEGDLDVELSADLSRTPSPFALERFILEDARLTTQARLLARFFPLLGAATESASGRLSFALHDLRADGLTMAALARSLTGGGQLELEGASIDSEVIDRLLAAARTVRSGSWRDLAEGMSNGGAGLTLEHVELPFRIVRGAVEVPPVRLAARGVSVTLSGATSLRGALDYDVALEGLGDARLESLPFELTGTLKSPRVTLATGELLDDAADEALEQLQAPVRERARDLLDRVRRGG